MRPFCLSKNKIWNNKKESDSNVVDKTTQIGANMVQDGVDNAQDGINMGRQMKSDAIKRGTEILEMKHLLTKAEKDLARAETKRTNAEENLKFARAAQLRNQAQSFDGIYEQNIMNNHFIIPTLTTIISIIIIIIIIIILSLFFLYY
jgi:hypothetical protein